MVIKEGDKIPNFEFFEEKPDNKVNIADLCASKKVAVFAVPGAFTPGCSEKHLPSYVEQAESLKQKGVSEIICIGVNDPFVMCAWGKQNNAEGKIRMLSDPKGEFTKQIGLTIDVPHLGGLRSKRYSMVVDNGVIKQLNVEPDDVMVVDCSLPEKLKI